MTLVYSCRDIVFRVPSLEVLRSSFRSRIMSDYRAWGSPRRVEVPMLLLKELLSTLILIIPNQSMEGTCGGLGRLCVRRS